ncbi:hypothetical protein [Brachybacterium sp. J153]|uniref:hypothetical protein n=1 Tax=Brachybacterium sp. J153 TaxID=3116488 RepID=UPI002E7A770C|nr:hypothetical protein [Brachybacterium sp. J153]MEE1617823.1 hypothetical protein [Brachybacterium sp. J153]
MSAELRDAARTGATPGARADARRPRVRALALLPVRWSGLALAAVFAGLGMWVECAVSMLVALAQVVAWRSSLPLAWEIGSSAVCLSAAVSSFLLLFERIPWWDVPTHLAANGLIAVLIARVLRPAGPSVAAIVRCGVAAAVVWEGMELAGSRWVDSAIYTAPADTALDIAAGVTGSVLAAFLWRRSRSTPPA